MSFTYADYLSPFSWRYGSREMRALWSEEARRRAWRRVWLALASAQAEAGLIDAAELEAIRQAAGGLDIEGALAREDELGHDVMAELVTFAQQAGPAGGKLHLGATSADVTDNADVWRLRQALALVRGRLEELLGALEGRIRELAAVPTLAFTHLQPAEPTTMGYRLALYAQDLLWDHQDLARLEGRLRAKGFRGAVGTAASYHLLLGEGAGAMEALALADLDLQPVLVSGQTYPRKQDLWVLSTLAGLAASLHKLSLDLRLLQSPLSGEWAEPFGARQVGSSAMPAKQNPVRMEKVSSLGRYVSALLPLAWENAALSWLERSLDDSANRRVFLAEAFLASDEMLRTATEVVRGLRVDAQAAQGLLERFGPLAALEKVLLLAARRGADRQALHERLRGHALAAREGPALRRRVLEDETLARWLAGEELEAALDPAGHVGDAPRRALALADRIAETLQLDAGEEGGAHADAG